MNIGDSIYMMTQRGQLMPGTLVGFGGESGELYDVAAPGGAVYTTRPHNVYSEGAGQAMMLRARVERMMDEGYVCSLFAAGAFHVYNPAKRAHKNGGGYIVTRLANGCMSCTCPSYSKNFALGNFHCKHSEFVLIEEGRETPELSH